MRVAVHLASLFYASSSKGKPTVAIAACLGDDQLGREARRRLSIKGVRTDRLQCHPEWETGMATAIIGEDGDATYEFVTPAATVTEDPELCEWLEAFQQGFKDWLDQEGTLEDHLPFHVRQLPYYRRLLAAGMASSLQRSLAVSGLEGRHTRDWLSAQELPGLLGPQENLRGFP